MHGQEIAFDGRRERLFDLCQFFAVRCGQHPAAKIVEDLATPVLFCPVGCGEGICISGGCLFFARHLRLICTQERNQGLYYVFKIGPRYELTEEQSGTVFLDKRRRNRQGLPFGSFALADLRLLRFQTNEYMRFVGRLALGLHFDADVFEFPAFVFSEFIDLPQIKTCKGLLRAQFMSSL